METLYRCPDCRNEHDQPGDAGLGHQVRCLDCQIEIDLLVEFQMMVVRPIAA